MQVIMRQPLVQLPREESALPTDLQSQGPAKEPALTGLLPLMKECSKCGRPWPRTREYFAEDKPRRNGKCNRDGLQSNCRACQRKVAIKWTREHPERSAYNSARWAEKNRARKEENHATWCAEHPRAIPAKSAMMWAIQIGRLVWDDSCELCGRRVKVHHHHEDYNRPLDVISLCPSCHRTVEGHKNRGEPDGLDRVRARQRKADNGQRPIMALTTPNQPSLDFGTNA